MPQSGSQASPKALRGLNEASHLRRRREGWQQGSEGQKTQSVRAQELPLATQQADTMAAVGLDMIPQEKELPASPQAPTKAEILANTSNEDEVAPLKPTKVIKMRRQTLRKRAATAANRLAGGRSTRDWDVHGNSAKNLSKLEELVAGSSKDMNAAEASMRLVAMMSGDVVEQTASRLRKSFGDLVDEELLRVLRTEPEARTEYDVDVVERHVS